MEPAVSAPTILVNGQPSGEMIFSINSPTILRGDGCFEVMRVYGGHAFEAGPHLDRLERSAEMLDLETPDRSDLDSWVEQVLACGEEGLIRVVLGRGQQPDENVCVVMWQDVSSRADRIRLKVMTAPWHSSGHKWDLAGGKTLSYAPNMASTRRAVKEGYDEALLVSEDGTVLEGPVFSVAWVCDGVFETPSLDLWILDSITRRVVLDMVSELGIPCREGRFGLDRMLGADEAMVIGTTREITPIVELDDHRYTAGPVTARLIAGFKRRIQQAIDGS